MTDHRNLLGMLALLISDQPDKRTVFGRALIQLITDVEERSISVITSERLDDAKSILSTDPAIQCVLLSWEMDRSADHQQCIDLLARLRERNTRVPVFLISDRSTASNVPLIVMQHADDFIWLPEDTSRFLSGRILAAMERYRQAVLPPMFGALLKFARSYEYSWHTPGHAGGTAFLKSTAGRAFYEFFGKTCCAPTCPFRLANWARCSTTVAPLARASDTRPRCSAPIAPTTSPMARRCRTG